MKRLTVSILLVLIGNALSAQSLDEMARRERERRQKLKQVGAKTAAVVSEEELRHNKGSLANDPSVSAVAPATPAVAARPPAPSVLSPVDLPEQQQRQLQDSWRTRANEARARIAAAQKEQENAKSQEEPLVVIKRERESSSAYDLTESTRGAIRARIARAGQALAAAQKALSDLEDQARRESIPPGWLR